MSPGGTGPPPGLATVIGVRGEVLRPLVPPLIQSTAYAWDDLAHPPAVTYARSGNPTVESLELSLAALEGGESCVCYGSGLAAIDALLRCVPGGSRIVVGRHLYGGTTRLIQRLHSDRLSIDFVDTTDPASMREALATRAAMVLVETPSNPTLRTTDLRLAADLAHDAGAFLAVDNTLLTPLYQSPIKLGADVCIHSTTKYLEGHNATLGGALVLSIGHSAPGESPDGPLAQRLRWMRKATGAVLSPFEAWLTLRGIRTLRLRTEAQWSSAARIARAILDYRPGTEVFYPGLPEDAGHLVHRRQATGDGGLVALDLGSFEAARTFTSRLGVFAIAENLGATESMVTHPASMTHADLEPKRRRSDGISDGLIRLSVGIENPSELESDVLRALNPTIGPREVVA